MTLELTGSIMEPGEAEETSGCECREKRVAVVPGTTRLPALVGAALLASGTGMLELAGAFIELRDSVMGDKGDPGVCEDRIPLVPGTDTILIFEPATVLVSGI